MTSNGTNEEGSLSPSQKLIKEKDVKAALLSDKGSSVVFKSYEIKDFTNKGDNYASVVSSVEVKYESEGHENSVTYVVKLNPCRAEMMEIFSKLTFEKEIGLYTKVIPMINEELLRVGLSKLKTAQCYHYVETPKEEVMYLEDLRAEGYKMADRQKGLDSDHVVRVLKELANLHAASQLLFSRGKYQDFDQDVEFPELKEFFTAGESAMDEMGDIIQNGSEMFDPADCPPQMLKFVEKYKGKSKQVLVNELKFSERFKTICHGDCWTNNFLFRYSPEGEVQDCRLLDFQVARIGSPALDLNYFLFSSTSRDLRKEHLHQFFLEYYAQFASAMAAGGVSMKFTFDELKEEYRAKHAFGLVMGMMVIPATLIAKEDAIEFDLKEGEDFEEKMKEWSVIFKKSIKQSESYKPRYVGMVEDIAEAGFFDDYKFVVETQEP